MVCVMGNAQDSLTTYLDTTPNFRHQWMMRAFFRDTLANDSLLEHLFYHQDAPQWNWKQNAEILGEPQKRNYPGNNWRYAVLLVLMTGVGLVRLTSPGGIVTYFRSFLKPKLLQEVLEDQDSEISSFSLLISFITSLMYALPAQWLLWQFRGGMTDYPLGDFLLLSLLIFLFILVRFVLSSTVGRIFEARYFVATTIYTSVFLNFFLAIVANLAFLMFLLNAWPLEKNQTLTVLLLSVMIVGGMKIIRSLTHAASHFTYPWFYLILYLCALEVGPWLWVHILLDY